MKKRLQEWLRKVLGLETLESLSYDVSELLAEQHELSIMFQDLQDAVSNMEDQLDAVSYKLEDLEDKE